MGSLGRIAIGSRAQVSYAEETEWGSPIAPTRRIGFNSESIQNTIGNLVSSEIDPTRSISKRAQGNYDIGGDVAHEQNSQGFETLYKHALGDKVTLNKVDGGVRAQVASAFTTPGTSLVVDDISVFEATPGSNWGLTVVYKNPTTGLLTSQAVAYSAVNTGTNTFTIIDPGVNLPKGAFVLQSYIGADDFWDNVYTHYIEAAKTLPVGLTLEVGRDIAFFVYSGCKVNTVENTFTSGEILQSTFSFMGKGEHIGGELSAAVAVGDTTFTIKEYALANSSNVSPAVQVVGAGLSDITVTGSYTGSALATYHIKISLAGATDEFDWSDDGGVTWTTGVVMTGAAQLLSNGVSVTWGAITGHVLNDEWRIQTGDIIGFNFSGGTVQMESENDITYTSYNSYNGVFSGVPGSGANSIEYAHAANLPVAPQVTWGTGVTEPPSLNPLSGFEAAVFINGVAQEVLSGSFTLNNNLFDGKYQLGSKERAGLPEQQRTVEGTINVEFDDLILYNDYVDGAQAKLEFRCVVDSNRIDSQGVQTAPAAHWVYSQKHCILPKIYYSGTTPNAAGQEQITYDMPFNAYRDPDNNVNELIMIFVNERTSI